MFKKRTVTHKYIYEGTRWKIVFGKYDGIEKFAIDEIQRAIQAYLPYVLEVTPHNALDSKENNEHLLILGTAQSNPIIKDFINKKKISIPKVPEAYRVSVSKSPWNKELSLIIIAGNDEKGLLNGVVEFSTKTLGVENCPDIVKKYRDALENIPAQEYSDYPRISYRGIWTWGYPIYDYRRFLDNMARLRMNMITIWNDVVPVNISEVIDYAHSRGIKVVLGFPWGWDYEGIDIAKKADIAFLKKEVMSLYAKDYANLKHDGIYFQTLTEHSETEKGGRPLAAIVCEMVNEIGGALLKKYPKLKIQFGLHASSIAENYKELENLDKRINITWEDAGTIPYAYVPDGINTNIKSIASQKDTLEYSKKLVLLRKNMEYCAVPKGFSAIRWGHEFEHHQSFILGERDARFARLRREERMRQWKLVNGLWSKNYMEAVIFYREMLALKPKMTLATALVEDGAFEEKIESSIALFANILWNPDMDEKLFPLLAESFYYENNF